MASNHDKVRKGLILSPGEGKMVSAHGFRVVSKVTDELSTTQSIFEFTAPPGFDVGAHIHSTHEEIFYILEGELDLRAGEQTMHSAGPGTLMFIPPGVTHWFANPANTPTRVLFIVSPSGFERFFEELITILNKPGQPDTVAIGELRSKFNTTQIAPHMFRHKV